MACRMMRRRVRRVEVSDRYGAEVTKLAASRARLLVAITWLQPMASRSTPASLNRQMDVKQLGSCA